MRYILYTTALFACMLLAHNIAVAQPPSRGQATEMIIAGDNSLQMLDLEQAIDFYSSAISLDPGFADAYMKRANAFAIAGRNTEAQQDYNMAVKLNPYIDYLYDSRAKVKVLIADFRGTLIDVDNTTLFRPGEGDMVLGYLFEQMRAMFPASLVYLDSLVAANPDASQNYAIRALALWEADDFNGAVADATKALSLNPTNALAHNILGLLQQAQGNYDIALAAFTQAITIDENYAMAYLNLGRTFLFLNQPAPALSNMDQALQLDSNYTLAYFSRGLAYKRLGKIADAIADYSKVIQLAPQLADAYYARGYAYKMNSDYEAAIRDYDQALVLKPNEPNILNNRGVALVLNNNYQLAYRDFRSAISQLPDYATAYHNLGVSMIMNHARTEGCEYLKTSINKGLKNVTDEYKYFCNY